MTTDIQKNLTIFCSRHEKEGKNLSLKIAYPLLYTIAKQLNANIALQNEIRDSKVKDCSELIQPAKATIRELQKNNLEIEYYYKRNNLAGPSYSDIIPIHNLINDQFLENYYKSCDEAILLLETNIIEKSVWDISYKVVYLLYIAAPSEATVKHFISQMGTIQDSRVFIPYPINIGNLNLIRSQIFDFIKQHRIYNDDITRHLEKLNNLKDNDLLGKKAALESILELLIRKKQISTHHLPFVEKYIELNANGAIISYKTPREYDIFLSKKTILKNIQSTTAWYAAEKFKILHGNYQTYGLDALVSQRSEEKNIYNICTIEEYNEFVHNLLLFIEHENKKDSKAHDNVVIEQKTQTIATAPVIDVRKKKQLSVADQRTYLDRKHWVLSVDGNKKPITSQNRKRYIKQFFNSKGFPKNIRIPDDVIHKRVFKTNADDDSYPLTKKEKDQVDGLKRVFKDIIDVDDRFHFLKSEYLK